MEETKLIKKKNRLKREGNVRLLAEVIKELGDMYLEAGRLEEALQEYFEQLETCEVLDDKIKCAIAHRMIGEIYADLGNYKEALVHQNLHLEGAREVQSLLEEQRAFATLGRTHFRFAEAFPVDCDEKETALSNAKKAYIKSIQLCDKLENTDIDVKELMTMRARLFLNLGLVLEAQKEIHQGIDFINKAAELCTKHNLHEDWHRTHIALGVLHEKQGNYESALEHLGTAANVKNFSLKSDALLAKTELLLRLGKWVDARKILVALYSMKDIPKTSRAQAEKLLRIVVTINNTESSVETEYDIDAKQKLYETLGDAASAVNCHEKAIEYYRGMLSCAESNDGKDISRALDSLAQTLRDAGRLEEALIFARRELQLCSNSQKACKSALYVADLLFAVNPSSSEIREMYEFAQLEAKKCQNITLQASVLKELLVYLEKSGGFGEAKIVRESLERLDVTSDSESESGETEGPNIGADICLEDLSDIENETNKTSHSRAASRPSKSLLPSHNIKGETPLHVACITGNIATVEKLLEAGHPTNVRDYCGWTPLHEAANHGHLEIAQLLIKAGANVNDPGGSSCDGITPLHDAASNGHFSIMSLLIKHGSNVKAVTKGGETILDCFESWKMREGELAPSEQSEYEEIHAKLSTLMPKNSKVWKKYRGKLIDDDDDDEDEKEHAPLKKISAAEDYKRTIENLKKRGGAHVLHSKSTTSPKKTALLLNEEILTDDWLEDDLGIKGRKKEVFAPALPVTAKRKSHNSEIHKNHNKRQRTVSEKSAEDAPSLICLHDEDSCDSNTSDIVTTFDRPRRPNRRMRQASLLSTGFTRDSMSRTPSPIFITSDTPKNNSFYNSDAKTINLQVWINEKVVDLKLEYPEQRDSTITDIQNIVKRKFEEDTGLRIQFQLAKMDGSILQSESTLESVAAGESILKLKSRIIDVHVPLISKRYGVICEAQRIDVDDTMMKCLKACENTFTFRLKANETIDEELTPLFKCLEFESPLQVLHLSGGSLFHYGDLLSNCIKKLPNLQELHLQSCDIDSNCLNRIEELPKQLRILDLSYNPLGTESEDKLHALLSPIKCLQTLNLCYCQLEGFRANTTHNGLINLDVSWNSLGGEGIRPLLKSQILTLNLTNTLHPDKSSVVMELMLNLPLSLCTLESLELAGCNVSDSDVKDILLYAPNLTRLDLNGNPSLSVRSAMIALGREPTLSYINVSGCLNVVDPPSTRLHITNPEACTLIISMTSEVQESWLRLWRGKGVVSKFPHNVTIFKPCCNVAPVM